MAVDPGRSPISSQPRRRGLLTDAKEAVSADGTRIAYYTAYGAGQDAPVVVLANGLGGPRLAWRALVEYLGDRYRFVTWDYRGLYASGRPPVSDRAAYSVPRHVDDLAAIVAAERIERAALVGWSMGVQVCIETFRQLPGLARSLVLLSGTFGRPLDTAVPTPLGRRLAGKAIEAAERYAVPLTRAVRSIAGQPEFVGWLKRAGMMAETVDESEFAEVVGMFATLDIEAFAKNLRALGEHDAERLLPVIDVPTLVITGDRDRMTPRGLSQQMVRRIPKAEILVVRGGTHYTAVEFPELVGLRIERFFRENGY